MEKYEYVSVRWDSTLLGRSSRVFGASGEIPRSKIFPPGTPSTNIGDVEVLQIFARLGELGWELVNVTVLGDRTNFISTGFFKRKISENHV